MSKEQTPITAEEYYKEMSVFPNEIPLFQLMEQYAQAKVLEVLESLPRYDIDDRGSFQASKNGGLIPYWAVEEIKKQK